MLFCCSCWLFLSKWKKQYKVPQWGFNISRLTTQKQWQRKRVNTTYKGVAEKMELSSFQTCLEKTTKAHGCKQHEVNSSWISESKNIHSETGVSLAYGVGPQSSWALSQPTTRGRTSYIPINCREPELHSGCLWHFFYTVTLYIILRTFPLQPVSVWLLLILTKSKRKHWTALQLIFKVCVQYSNIHLHFSTFCQWLFSLTQKAVPIF